MVQRVSVCLVGYPRTFVEYHVWRNVRRDAHAYAKHGRIFAVLQNDHLDTKKGQPDPANASLLNAIMASFEQAETKIVSSPPRLHKCDPWFPINQWRKMDVCESMIRLHEAEHNISFDWVVKMRPDVVNDARVAQDWNAELRSDTIYGSKNSGDLRMYIPRKAMPLLSQVYNAKKCVSADLNKRLFTLSGFKHRTIDLCDCVIIRTTQANHHLQHYSLDEMAWNQIRNAPLANRNVTFKRPNARRRGYGLTYADWIRVHPSSLSGPDDASRPNRASARVPF